MYHIDLNCDLGESFGTYKLGQDEEMLEFVTSVNIACGYHAGDPKTMRETVELAVKRQIGIGAHPGFPDLNGFGRRNMDLSSQEIYDILIYQISALEGFVRISGGTLQHVKPHGALYNMASTNQTLADAIAKAVYDLNPSLILYGLSGSELIKAGSRIGLRTASEVFADRTYQEDGTLTSRRLPEAMIKDDQSAVQQVLRMVKESRVISTQDSEIPIKAETVCIHGDGPNALAFARFIRTALEKETISVHKFDD